MHTVKMKAYSLLKACFINKRVVALWKFDIKNFKICEAFPQNSGLGSYNLLQILKVGKLSE